MRWTFPGTVLNCSCLNNLTIDMDWDNSLNCWKGSAVGCLGTIYAVMNEAAGVAQVGISGTSYAVALSNVDTVSHVCSAFNATGNITSDQDTVCGIGQPAGSVPVDISER